MTITQNLSAPLAVLGVTGNQGGSVVKALAESDKPYRTRGLTRDVTKPAACELAAGGVEMVAAALTSDNAAAARKVFTGGNIVFAVTNYWEHLDVTREVAEGKMLLDAAKAAGVGLFIWSGLESLINVSNGKYPNVHHFNGKGEITEYGKRSGIPFVNVQSGWYATNFCKIDGMKPKKLEDGTYVLALPVGPQTLLPVIDTANDYGLFVREAIECPEFGPGSETWFVSLPKVSTSHASIAPIFLPVTGKKIAYGRISDEEFVTVLIATGMPPSVAREVLESLKYHEECGYYAGKSTEASRRHLARPTRTWADFVRSTD
ncbi:NAD(P)-binding protein [Mycena haematopus]|nr:NAD(P)-binding protein [Mycena haematopus]